MTEAKKWNRQPVERPRQITSAALEVFSRKGYRAATMQEIAEAAGITKGTIYLYFKSKTDLFVETIRTQFDEAIELVPQINYEPGQDPEELTRKVGRAFLDVLMTPKIAKVLPLVIAEYNHLPRLRTLYFEEVFSKADLHVARLIDMGKSLGLVRDVNPEIAARCLLGAFFGIVLSQEVFGAKEYTPMDKDDIVSTIATVFFRGLATPEALA